MMKCSFCGFSFDEQTAQKGCNGCPFQGGCRKIKCPNCGFEMPEEAGLVKLLRNWRGKRNGTEHQGS